MVCDNYSVDVSEIEGYIRRLRDAAIKKQIQKKIEKIKKNPSIGETKSFKLKGVRAVKVNDQKIVITYKLDDEDPCKIVFIDIGPHDDVYKDTY